MKTMEIFKTLEGRQEIIAVYGSLLEHWPIPYETQMVPTKYGNTHVISFGKKEAEPLVLLHGSGSNSIMWIGDAAALGGEYRVYAIDIPGEPGKSNPIRQDLFSEAYAFWLEEVLHYFNIHKTILIGISLGGWMAFKFSTFKPEAVSKMVLLCPSGIAPAKLSFLFLAILLLPMGQKGMNLMNRVLYGKQKINPEAVKYGNIIMKNFNPIMTPIPVFSDSELKKLTMPVLLIAGELDALLPSKKTAARLKKLLPGIEIDLLKDFGHVLIGFTEKILVFLRK